MRRTRGNEDERARLQRHLLSLEQKRAPSFFDQHDRVGVADAQRGLLVGPEFVLLGEQQQGIEIGITGQIIHSEAV